MLGDDLEIGGRRRVRLTAPLFPILQCRQRDAVDAGEFLVGTSAIVGGWRAHRALRSHATRTPPGLPSACSQASLRLSIRSLLNLFMLSSTPVSLFQPRNKRLHHSPRIRREVVAPCLRVDHQQVKRHCRIMVEVDDAGRTPPRLPLPRRPHLTLRTPPLAGIRSPASGVRAMKSTNSKCSPSVQSAPAWRMNTAVSATVIGRVRISAMYAIGVYFQERSRG